MSDEIETPQDATTTAVEESPAPAKKTARKTAAKKTAKKAPASSDASDEAPQGDAAADDAAAKKAPAKKAAAKKAAKKASAKPKKAAAAEPVPVPDGEVSVPEESPSDASRGEGSETEAAKGAPMALFQVPEIKKTPAKKAAKKAAPKPAVDEGETTDLRDTPDGAPQGPGSEEPETDLDETSTDDGSGDDTENDGDGPARRRRRRGGRRRRKPAGAGGDDSTDDDEDSDADDESEGDGDDASAETTSSRRTRTRAPRAPRNPEDEITSISGSTRLEAKKQRRREGREAGRRRAPIASEAEFLARRESVDRVMVIRQREGLTQIGVLEDKVLVEHYVSREAQASMIGNVYLGRVQNVLPSMEAAFIDIGKGRNAVLYAGEVNWSGLGHKDGAPRKIEAVLSPGQVVLVQVTKDPVGHKGARLTGQISLPGRFLVYVPDGTTSGISRKLPDTERNRLKTLLKEIVPDTAGVIVRTAAEGASEEELTRDVERLTARWSDIEAKVAAGKSPELLYGEPDLTLKVVRDLFTEDFSKLVVQGDDAWDLVSNYVEHVAPDLSERLERFEADSSTGSGQSGSADATQDLFAAYRVDEQIAKALERKVWLPSGGSLIIDRTEAMTVVDVNTGKFTGSGGNLEETVTKNNLEAAEEMVRQLRLRDIGGIIVIDFIDMVLESNRDLVLRRLVECLGRDRTRHQVAEVTSLGLVQMTRKKIGTGLLEAFSEECSECKGRGVIVHAHPVSTAGSAVVADDEPRSSRRRGGRRRGGAGAESTPAASSTSSPSPKDLAASHPPAEPVAPLPMLNETGTDEPIDALDLDTPAAQPADDAPVEPTSVPEEAVEDKPVVEEAPASSGPQGRSGEPEAEPGAVVVSTRRRRTASRPAGAPEGSEAVAITVEPASVPEQGEARVEESEPEHLILHVPVKRRGGRRH